MIVALSNVGLRSPCRRLSANSGECGIELMVKHLPRGGVFVAWTEGGLVVPSDYPAGMPGDSTTVGGRRTKVSFDPPTKECGWLKPAQASTAYIAGASTAYIAGQVQMIACARDSKDFKDQVDAMLKSVKFRAPPDIPKVGS